MDEPGTPEPTTPIATRGWMRCRLGDICGNTRDTLLGRLCAAAARHGREVSPDQLDAWSNQLDVMHKVSQQLAGDRPNATEWVVVFEYTIPRRGRRIDVVVLAEGFRSELSETSTHFQSRVPSRAQPAAEGAHHRSVPQPVGAVLRLLLLDELARELKLADRDDVAGFEKSIGGSAQGEYIYFNRGNAQATEAWQILSPVRGMPHGVTALNGLVHRQFRQNTIDFARRDRYRKIPRPMGPEEVVYGDKVICIRNHNRWKVWPEEDAAQYIANGEMGLVVGQFKTKKMKKAPSVLKVEFSSQPQYMYTFFAGEFGDEQSPILELAYAFYVARVPAAFDEVNAT